MKLRATSHLHDGSYLANANGVQVRVIEARVTITTEADTRTSEYRLITTLLDPSAASAKQLVELYHDRWEIETAYCELKSTILGWRVLPACGKFGHKCQRCSGPFCGSGYSAACMGGKRNLCSPGHLVGTTETTVAE